MRAFVRSKNPSHAAPETLIFHDVVEKPVEIYSGTGFKKACRNAFVTLCTQIQQNVSG